MHRWRVGDARKMGKQNQYEQTTIKPPCSFPASLPVRWASLDITVTGPAPPVPAVTHVHGYPNQVRGVMISLSAIAAGQARTPTLPTTASI
jgi:hypothetical protein